MVTQCLTYLKTKILRRAVNFAVNESRIAKCSLKKEIILRNYSPCQTDRRMFGNKKSFSCQSNLPFCVDDEKEIHPKTYRGLPQASHGITRDGVFLDDLQTINHMLEMLETINHCLISNREGLGTSL